MSQSKRKSGPILVSRSDLSRDVNKSSQGHQTKLELWLVQLNLIKGLARAWLNKVNTMYGTNHKFQLKPSSLTYIHTVYVQTTNWPRVEAWAKQVSLGLSLAKFSSAGSFYISMPSHWVVPLLCSLYQPFFLFCPFEWLGSSIRLFGVGKSSDGVHRMVWVIKSWFLVTIIFSNPEESPCQKGLT